MKVTDEGTKDIQGIHHILIDIQLLPSTPTLLYNDNTTTCEYTSFLITKHIQHYNILEHCVREAVTDKNYGATYRR